MSRGGCIALVAGALGMLTPGDAAACSCVGPHDMLIGPDRVDDAPLNAKVRLEVPAQSSRAAGAVVRIPGGAKVDVSSRQWADGSLTFVELTPAKPLQAGTRYEVAIVDPAEYPSTTVIGTFKTAAVADTTPPRLHAIGAAVAKGNARAGGGDCSIRGPWIEVGPVRAEDPGRPGAKLLFALWPGDAKGNIDTTKPPAALLQGHGDQVTIGQRSLCDPRDFPLPQTPFMALAIAAVDEAGNTSPPLGARVDLRGVGAHP